MAIFEISHFIDLELVDLLDVICDLVRFLVQILTGLRHFVQNQLPQFSLRFVNFGFQHFTLLLDALAHLFFNLHLYIVLFFGFLGLSLAGLLLVRLVIGDVGTDLVSVLGAVLF